MYKLNFKGTRTIYRGHEEGFLKCPSCETTTLSEIAVSSRYFYWYGIPVCPTGKEARIECTKCGLKRKEVPIEEGSVVTKADLQNKYNHPWYSYIGIGFAVLILSMPLLAWIFE
jgi:transcription elongation factor Elf1